MLFVALYLSLCTLASASELSRRSTAPKKCPITFVASYLYTCRLQANIRDPALLRKIKKVPHVKNCAQTCLNSSECKSFRYDTDGNQCNLYSKFLDQMFTDYDTTGPGLLYDADCFSTDCNVIAACKATAQCENTRIADGEYTYDGYARYACNYGRTARTADANGTPFPVAVHEFYNASKTTACQAIEMCTKQFTRSSLDVHLDLKTNQWECTVFDDSTATPYDCMPHTYDEDVSRSRYTVRNDSVGAGYGVWWDGVYYESYRGKYCVY